MAKGLNQQFSSLHVFLLHKSLDIFHPRKMKIQTFLITRGIQLKRKH